MDPIAESLYRGFHFNWKSPASSELCLTQYLPVSQVKNEKTKSGILVTTAQPESSRRSLVFHTGLCSIPQTDRGQPPALSAYSCLCKAFSHCPPLAFSVSVLNFKNHLLRKLGLTTTFSHYPPSQALHDLSSRIITLKCI